MHSVLDRHPVLAYTAARILLFAVALGLLWVAGLRSVVLVVAALLVSGVLSYWLLSRPRQEMSVAVAGRLSRIRSGLEVDAAAEDDEYDEQPGDPASLGDDRLNRATGRPEV